MRRLCLSLATTMVTLASVALGACQSPAPTSQAPSTTTSTTITTATSQPTVPATSGTATTQPTAPATTGKESPKYGGQLTYVITGQAFSSPQMIQVGTQIGYINSFAYERLVMGDWAKGPEGTNQWSFFHYTYVPPQYLTGALAESWEQTDPVTFIYHLRKGVRFQNKPPVNAREVVADDIVYSYYHYQAHPELAITTEIASVSAVDKYTVKYVTKRINSELGSGQILGDWVHPKEMVDKYTETSADVAAVCGTGPFQMTDFVSGSSFSYKRNPDYWGHDEVNPQNQLPYVDTLKLLTIIDPTTRLSALRTGKLDYIQNVASLDAASLMQTNPDLKWYRELNYIASPKINMRMDKIPFSDRRVRLALAMSVDRNSIVKDYLKGDGVILSYPIMATWTDQYTPLEQLPASTQEQFKYDPVKAKQLLADAGYPGGFKTEIIVDAAFVERVQIFQAYFLAIGVDMKINVVDRATWNNLTYGKTYPAMSAGSAGSVSPYGVMSYKKTGQYYNYEMYTDPKVDAWLDQVVAEFDLAKKNAILKEMQAYYLDAVPMIAFPSENIYAFWQPWMKNYRGENILASLNQGGIAARVWIDQDLKARMGR
jgi:peptide/nickel transport system substrate-binding protein